jgi:hypothetical protein
MLPNLIVVGAAKAGTTSLHHYLDRHPQIAMSGLKELKFFTRDDWRDELGWYAAQFSDAPVRGESSPTYSMHPYLSSTAERIAELIPDCRLIYVLRDPVQRAIAGYVEHAFLGFESRDIVSALTDIDDPANPHLCPSRYATQLRRFLDCFPAEQLLVVDQWDLLHQRVQTLRDVFDFVGVDPDFTTAAFDEVHNTAAEKVRYNLLGRWLIRKNLFTERADYLYRGPLIPPLRRVLSRPIDRQLPPPAKAQLVAALEPEVEELRRLTGRAWDRWPSYPV